MSIFFQLFLNSSIVAQQPSVPKEIFRKGVLRKEQNSVPSGIEPYLAASPAGFSKASKTIQLGENTPKVGITTTVLTPSLFNVTFTNPDSERTGKG